MARLPGSLSTWFGTQKTPPHPRATRLRRPEAFDATDGAVLGRRQGNSSTPGTPRFALAHGRARTKDRRRYLAGDSTAAVSRKPGIRLIKQEKVDEFAAMMADYKAELDDAVANLDRHFDSELKTAAAMRLRLTL